MSGPLHAEGRLVLPPSLLVMHVEQVQAAMQSWLVGLVEGDAVVDAQAVTEVDGAGLQLLLSLGRTLRDRGLAARLDGASDHLLAMAATLGLRNDTHLCGLVLRSAASAADITPGASGTAALTGVCA